MRASWVAVQAFALASLCLSTVAFAQTMPPDDVVFQPDINYGKAGDVELKLNLSKPAKPAAEALPCVVVIHGGGWAAGHRNHHNNLTWRLAQQGYVAVTISYRFAPEHVFPAQVEDVKCAVRYLRAHAKELGIDAEHIGAVGVSAGAHLSMMLATMGKEDGLEGDGGWADQSSRVQAAVSFVGPTDLAAEDLPERTRGIMNAFLGGDPKDKTDAHRKASPLTYVSEGDPPMLLFQGVRDQLIPNSQAFRMVEAMDKHAVAGRVELISGAGHGFGGKEIERTITATVSFLDEHLKK